MVAGTWFLISHCYNSQLGMSLCFNAFFRTRRILLNPVPSARYLLETPPFSNARLRLSHLFIDIFSFIGFFPKYIWPARTHVPFRSSLKLSVLSATHPPLLDSLRRLMMPSQHPTPPPFFMTRYLASRISFREGLPWRSAVHPLQLHRTMIRVPVTFEGYAFLGILNSPLSEGP